MMLLSSSLTSCKTKNI